jgi:hypothetical protein
MLSAVPRLPARALAGLPGVSARLVVRCDWCEEDHTHGVGAGHRAAHCTCSDSPYRGTGYELIQVGGLDRSSKTPEALYLGQRRLRDGLSLHAPRYRSTLLAALIGARPGRFFDKRVGRARISVFGDSWVIDPDAYPSRSELCADVLMRRSARHGRNIVALLAALFGISPGIVGVRLFEAATGMPLDAEFRRVMAAEVEALCARAGNGDGRP